MKRVDEVLILMTSAKSALMTLRQVLIVPRFIIPLHNCTMISWDTDEVEYLTKSLLYHRAIYVIICKNICRCMLLYMIIFFIHELYKGCISKEKTEVDLNEKRTKGDERVIWIQALIAMCYVYMNVAWIACCLFKLMLSLNVSLLWQYMKNLVLKFLMGCIVPSCIGQAISEL